MKPIIQNKETALQRIKAEFLEEGLFFFYTGLYEEKIDLFIKDFDKEYGTYQDKSPGELGIHYMCHNKCYLIGADTRNKIKKISRFVDKGKIIDIRENHLAFSELLEFRVRNKHLEYKSLSKLAKKFKKFGKGLKRDLVNYNFNISEWQMVQAIIDDIKPSSPKRVPDSFFANLEERFLKFRNKKDYIVNRGIPSLNNTAESTQKEAKTES